MEALGAIGIFAVIIGLLLSVLWCLLPFAVFGVKARLDAMTAELRKANTLLAAMDRTSKKALDAGELANEIAAAAGGIELE